MLINHDFKYTMTLVSNSNFKAFGKDILNFFVFSVSILNQFIVTNSLQKIWKLSSYPLYHSVYESFHLVEKYVDPDFKVRTYIRCCVRFIKPIMIISIHK